MEWLDKLLGRENFNVKIRSEFRKGKIKHIVEYRKNYAPTTGDLKLIEDTKTKNEGMLKEGQAIILTYGSK